MSERHSVFYPLRYREYRALWGASVLSNFGGLVQGVGAAWLMTQLTTSATLVALVQASTTLPYMIFALMAGALADLFDRRALMLAAQAFMLLASITLAVIGWTGGLTPWLLLSLTFLIGVGAAIYNPPWQASMGDLVPRAELPSAVTLNSVGFNLMRGVGPAAGGLIVAAWGAAASFTVNALSYLPLIFTLLRWRPPAQARSVAAREPFPSAVRAGLRYVALSPNLLRVLGRGGLFGFAAISVLALLPLVAKSHTEGGSLLYGLLLGCYGLGAIIGAVLNPPMRERFDNETIVRLAFAGFALAATVLATTGSVWLHALALLPAGAAWVLALSLFNVTVQLSTPRWVVARALALYQTATFGGMAAGSWLWGWIANGYGWQTSLLAAAVVLFAGALVGFWFRAPEFGAANLDPLNQFRAPALGLDLRGRSGPLLIMVDYEINQGDVPEFLRLMQQRRAIRRRDGARGWTLLRDIEQPSTWVESFHIATWDEYVRHNLRRTTSEAEVTIALRALHRGTGDPIVHRMIERRTVPAHEDVPLVGKADVL
ncbi:MFS transporter [Paracoccus suum]|uniref:MFS transporter n=1 Tax=Paracoccus suum TaxID=2259340 RepID=A0A344PGJ5_9RHOB|nr:MFS transporter [Paracoccus suum]AXC48500.1 MFS transporter [Paracoccus suum]